MTETHSTGDAHGHAEEHPHPNYWAVFGVLIALTAVSFITIQPIWTNNLGHQSGPMVVMIVAVFKALLVALYFMHLKFDWFKVYVMVVPALILGTVLICALLPDMTFSKDVKWNWINNTFAPPGEAARH